MNLSLWPACVSPHSFDDQLGAAAAAGFDRLPVGALTVREQARQGVTATEMVQQAADLGVRLGHYDGFTDWSPQRFSAALPAEAKAVFDFSTDECLGICAELGLDAVCATGAFDAGAFPPTQLADCLARFCEKARPLGIRVDLEFIPMWGIPDLATAWEIVRLAAVENVGLLFDTWHFCRGSADFDLLASLPRGAITTVQLADAGESTAHLPLLEECLGFRLPPGEGDLPLARILSIILEKGGVVDIGPEVFSDELNGLPAVDSAARVFRASQRLMAATGGPQ